MLEYNNTSKLLRLCLISTEQQTTINLESKQDSASTTDNAFNVICERDIDAFNGDYSRPVQRITVNKVVKARVWGAPHKSARMWYPP